MRFLLALTLALCLSACDTAEPASPVVPTVHAEPQCPAGQVRVCSPGDRGVVCTCLLD